LNQETGGTISNDPRYSDFNRTFNVYDNVTTQVTSIKENIVNADTDFGAFGVLNSLIATSWQGVKLLFSSFGFMDSVFGGLSTMFGIPSWVGGFAILLIIVIIAFAIWAAIFQTQW
jgi:protein-S-isoprenylcysteine O-methyltransferase Ste14